MPLLYGARAGHSHINSLTFILALFRSVFHHTYAIFECTENRIAHFLTCTRGQVFVFSSMLVCMTWKFHIAWCLTNYQHVTCAESACGFREWAKEGARYRDRSKDRKIMSDNHVARRKITHCDTGSSCGAFDQLLLLCLTSVN